MKVKLVSVLPTSPERRLDYMVAEAVFGWKWKPFVDIPVRDTAGYPKECRVIRFLSAKALANPAWVEYLEAHEAQDVTQEEFETLPLDYCYCSSRGPEYVPQYSGIDDIDVLAHVRRHWPRASDQWKAFRAALPPADAYQPGDYSRAALKALGVECREALTTGEGE